MWNVKITLKKKTTSGHIKNKLPHFYVYRIIRNIKITWKTVTF